MSTRPERRRVAVTGVGIVTALGLGKAVNWQRLTAGESGIHRLTRFPIDGLKTTVAGSVDYLDLPNPTAPALGHAMARFAVLEALEESARQTDGAFPGPLFLAAPPVEHEWPQRQVLAARVAGGFKAYTDFLTTDFSGLEALHEEFLFASIADRLATEFGTLGSPITLTTACASGATAIQLGAESIRRGGCTAALCVATDGSIHPESLIRFSLLSALSTSNEDPAKTAKPFSKNRDGFVMAEGAAALVLEDAALAEARGAEILGYLAGLGEAADTFHRTRSNPNGLAIIRCMKSAIEDAGLTPDDIDYINAHGTGTPENDKMESFGIEQVFGARASKIPVSSNKSMIGHTLTAAGAVETAISLLTLRHQLLPPTINYEIPDPTIPLDVVPNKARPAKVRNVLSNSFGFGGQNASIVISAEPR
jgi:3-oxoacyl-[acyl-carrier-protein] synthase II